MNKKRKYVLLMVSLMVVMILQPLRTTATESGMDVPEEGWKVIKSELNGGEFVVDVLELGNTHSFISGERNHQNSQGFFEVATGLRQLTYLSMNSMETGNGDGEAGSLRVYLLGRHGKDLRNQKLPQGELLPIDPNRPMVALTFDDGPSGYTMDILDTLEHYRSRASFFVLGSIVEQHQDIIYQAHQRGNEILGHSWSHENFNRLPSDQIASEITRTHDAITAIVGDAPRFYRPPYGSANANVRQVSEELGFSIINWNVDPSDWMLTDPDEVYDSIMELIGHRSVVVLHDTRASTAEAMERVIPSLIQRGYQLVTVSEMFYYLGVEVEPGMMVDWNW